MTNAILRGKPDAGNPHVRFDEGEVASAKPRRGSLLYTESEALKVLARQEKMFSEAGFARGIVLAKSAREYYGTILDSRRKVKVVSEKYTAAQKTLAQLTAKIRKMEAHARKELEEVAHLRAQSVRLRKIVRNGDLLKNKERLAQHRFEEKVELLRRMTIS